MPTLYSAPKATITLPLLVFSNRSQILEYSDTCYIFCGVFLNLLKVQTDQRSTQTLSCRSSSRSLMMSCLSSAGRRSAGQALSSVSTKLLQDCRAWRLALRLRRTRFRSTTCCRMEFTSWNMKKMFKGFKSKGETSGSKTKKGRSSETGGSSLTSINKGLCPIAAIPCRAFTSATSTLWSSCQNIWTRLWSRNQRNVREAKRAPSLKKLTFTLQTVCPCSFMCSQLEITCSIWARSKKSSCSSSGMSWLKSMASSTLSNFLRTDQTKLKTKW